RFGLFNSVWIGAVACVASLVISALSAGFFVFSGARLLSGVAAAIAFVAGGALATNIALTQRERSTFYQSLFYIGPAVGLLISGLVAPFILQANGRGSWWIVWAWLAVISIVLTTILAFSKFEEPPTMMKSRPARCRLLPVLHYLSAHCIFVSG